MIVKNESHCIERCLTSIKNHIDYYVICDTGSTDDTIQKIKSILKDIQGEIYQDEWIDFETNRNLALSRCKGDWIVTIDADEEFIGNGLINLDSNYDAYVFSNKSIDIEYKRCRIFKNNNEFRYKGKTHEFLHFNNKKLFEIKSHYYKDHEDSSRRKGGNKFKEDIKILSKELEIDPNNARNVFYLALAYQSNENYEKAIEYHLKRIELKGWEEEVYFSVYQIGLIKTIIDKDVWSGINKLIEAWIYRPNRLESLVMACQILKSKEAWAMIYHLSKNKAIPNNDVLFVNNNTQWMIEEEFGIAAYHLSKKQEAKEIFEKISSINVPELVKIRLLNNIKVCNS